MTKHLERDLENLERDILTQSSVAEEMIRTASRSLCERDTAAIREVLQHEPSVNEREVRIEEECLKILALHQPVAIDLRRVATVLKVNSDLERIADLAVNICERARALEPYPEFEVPPALEKMSVIAIEMVRAALDALVDLDAEAARRVMKRDNDVDNYNRDVIDGLYNVMREQSDLVEASLHYFSASRHIERIADHATNIAEDVIYLVEGEIARHRDFDPVDMLPTPHYRPKG